MWAIFALLDPGPDSESGYGSTDLIESGSNPNPNPDPEPGSETLPCGVVSFGAEGTGASFVAGAMTRPWFSFSHPSKRRIGKIADGLDVVCSAEIL
jgi:hypothetical protein